MLRSVGFWGAAAVLLVAGTTGTVEAQSTAFTYQGRLRTASTPVNGTYDFTFKLFDALVAGTQHGPTLTFDGVGANPAPIAVAGGLLTVQLDFGNRYPGAARYLEIALRPHASGSYTTLTPRQPLTAAPYALGLEWPFVGTTNTSSDAFTVTNNGAGAGVNATGGGDGVVGNGPVNGVHGISPGAEGTGVLGICNNGTSAYGVWGESSSGLGVVGTQTTSGNFGEVGALTSGVYGNATTGDGVSGVSAGGNGASGTSNAANGNGVLGICNSGSAAYGVWGESSSGIGVVGTNTTSFNYGELGTASYGVYGSSSTGAGVWASSSGNGLSQVALRADNQSSAGIGVWSTTNSSDANIVATNTGTGDIFRGFSGPSGGNLVFQVQNNGTTVVSVLQITGGADLAEHFPMTERVQPGMVVEIDPQAAGKLRLSHGAYNPRLAGVISGANRLSAGVVLSDGQPTDGSQAVALSGRVWVYCDASEQAIAPGDLLTTAARPGYAMRVGDHARADGAILGKAMSTLQQGEAGLVLVLLNLH